MKNNDENQNLIGKEALDAIIKIGKNVRTCMFATGLGSKMHSCPMSIQAVEEDGSFYFLSGINSEKNQEILKDPTTSMSIQNDGKSEYLHLIGKTTIHTDQETKEKYWSNFAKAWFEGVDDPELTVLKFEPENGNYWTTENGKMYTFAKMLYAAAANSEVDDGSVKGKLKID